MNIHVIIGQHGDAPKRNGVATVGERLKRPPPKLTKHRAVAARHADMRVLFCHGLESGPGGFKPRALRSQGATVTAPDMAMSLWNPTKRNSVVLGLLSPRAMLTRWP